MPLLSALQPRRPALVSGLVSGLFSRLFSGVACCLAALAPLTNAGSVRAEEPDAPQGVSDHARDTIAAGEIGRGLIASDPALRSRATQRLLARLEEGQHVERFLQEMSSAVETWANQHERLMEVWLDRAVNGTTAEQEQAVRLLSALGPRAVERLAGELRHHTRNGPVGDDAPSAGDKPTEPQEPVQVALPRLYDVADLLAWGWEPFKVKTMLLRQADAVSVRAYGSSFTVTATADGHLLLGTYLAALRASHEAPPQQAEDTATAQRTAHGGDTAQAAAVPERPAVPLATPKLGVLAWKVVPLLLHLPRGQSLQARLGAENSAFGADRPLLATSEILTGTVEDAERWGNLTRKLPNAHMDVPLVGETIFAANESAELFAGKQIPYTKDYELTPAGGLRPRTETLRHGIQLKVHVVRAARGLGVRIDVQQTDVGRPVPVMQVRPSADAGPVELESPQWSVTRRSDSFQLPHEGGGAFLPLPGIGNGPEDHVILLLSVVPYSAAPRQAAESTSK